MSLFNFLKSQVQILSVISEYVSLKAAGGYFKGPCPFHSEKDASFTISPDKGIYYCFGCHSSGDVIAFIAKIENLNQLEAALYLIEKYQIQVPQDYKNSLNINEISFQEKDLYLKICEAIESWTNNELFNSKAAKEYLIKSRNLNDTDIKYFSLGYLPGGLKYINRLADELKRKNFLIKDVLDTGFLQENGSILYSPFEERIIFPIKDHQGKTIGFGGRVFKVGDERPKYYNSKESSSFIKGKLLFGLDLAKKTMQQKKTAFLVEGYMDCITMVKYGFANTIATLGTACTIDHLKLLSRYIETLYVTYDGDSAGQNAILRLTELCWEAELDLKIIQLPPKEDPASFLNKGMKLERLIEKSPDIFSFFIEKTSSSFINLSLTEKISRSKKIIEVIAKINDNFKQNLLLQSCSANLNLPVESLRGLLESIKKQNLFKNESTVGTETTQKTQLCNNEYQEIEPISLLEKNILFAIINNVKKANFSKIEEDLIQYFSPKMQELLKKLLETLKLSKNENWIFDFLGLLTSEEQDFFNKNLSNMSNNQYSKEIFDQLILQFMKQNWRIIVKNIKEEIVLATKSKNNQKVQELMAKFSTLKQEMKLKGLL